MKRILTAVATAAALFLSASVPADEIVGQESEIKLQIELESNVVDATCQAQFEMEYYQKGSSAVVESVLTNEHCAASSGSYLIQVRYRDGGPDIQTREFPETWERTDDAPIISVREYFIGDDVDVLRVRSRNLRCTCTLEEEAVEE